jgi:glyoxylate reductase
MEISGATVGVVGMGGIGRRYSRMVKSLGAQVVYASPRPKLEAERALDARRLELPDLLATSDVVSLHAPANDDTYHLIGARELDRIGPGGVLVNTSRGPLVDELQLASALTEGRLGAAGIDVYENEPEVPRELLDAPRCVLLPHIGSATSISRDAMALLVADNVAAVLEGRDPRSPVS